MEPAGDWIERVNHIFSEALNLPSTARESYVRQSCAKDPALEASVVRLLRRFDQLGSFLEKPAVPAGPAADYELKSGDLLAERFRVLELAGRGGMGEVYRAEDLTLGETVALKIVRAKWRSDPSLLVRFREEIKLARRLSHPNLCRIFELFTSAKSDGEEIVFFTMEYLDGEFLSDVLASGNPLPSAKILQIASGVAAGVDASHREGILHRDLKPGNIVLVHDWQGALRPVITDFGLAKCIEAVDGSTTQGGAIAGSPNYMAPEQFLGERLTPATDIYSLAVILYEMAAGCRPFPEESIFRAAVRRITGTPIPLRQAAPKSPRHWDRVLAKALSTEPSSRHKTAEALVRELQERPAASLAKITAPSRRTVVTGAAAAAALSSFFVFRRYLITKPPVQPLVMLTPITAIGRQEEGRALDLQLEKGFLQSSHVTLLDRAQAGQAWQRMGRQGPLPATLDPRDAREIALRSGVDFVFFGDLQRGSDEWSLKTRLERMGTSNEHPREEQTNHFYADNDQRLLQATAKAVDWTRRIAGENAEELASRSRAPEEVTTNNWEALKEFMRASESWRARAEDQAFPRINAPRPKII